LRTHSAPARFTSAAPAEQQPRRPRLAVGARSGWALMRQGESVEVLPEVVDLFWLDAGEELRNDLELNFRVVRR
jgi:hypothetical protein